MTVTLTTAPESAYPATLAPESFDTVCDALGLGGFRAVGELRLRTTGTWTFTVGDDAYRMDVAE